MVKRFVYSEVEYSKYPSPIEHEMHMAVSIRGNAVYLIEGKKTLIHG